GEIRCRETSLSGDSTAYLRNQIQHLLFGISANGSPLFFIEHLESSFQDRVSIDETDVRPAGQSSIGIGKRELTVHQTSESDLTVDFTLKKRKEGSLKTK
ncbi:hypothetical protein AVEN_83554-1, partial [Araneus ventricosus]